MKSNIVVKTILFIILTLLGVLYLVLLGGSIYEAVVFPQSPHKVTLSKAVEMDLNNKPEFLFFEKALFVDITDASWKCASVKQVDAFRNRKDHTDGVFTNSSESALVFVQIEGLYSCQELQKMEIAGKLQKFTNRPVEYQSDTNKKVVIDENSNIITFELCTHCTPSEARFYPLYFLGFPFVMWLIFEFGKRQQQN